MKKCCGICKYWGKMDAKHGQCDWPWKHLPFFIVPYVVEKAKMAVTEYSDGEWCGTYENLD
jgi:hypothetical protein